MYLKKKKTPVNSYTTKNIHKPGCTVHSSEHVWFLIVLRKHGLHRFSKNVNDLSFKRNEGNSGRKTRRLH